MLTKLRLAPVCPHETDVRAFQTKQIEVRQEFHADVGFNNLLISGGLWSPSKTFSAPLIYDGRGLEF